MWKYKFKIALLYLKNNKKKSVLKKDEPFVYCVQFDNLF